LQIDSLTSSARETKSFFQALVITALVRSIVWGCHGARERTFECDMHLISANSHP
ncbi:hypothetical protein BLOT_004135, partial [Blomia tropicalis]